MSSPQGAGTLRCVGDEGGQFGGVGNGEQDVGAAAAARRAAVCLDGEITIGKQPDVECCQRERVTRRVSVHRCVSGIVTLIASAVTSGASPLLMTAIVRLLNPPGVCRPSSTGVLNVQPRPRERPLLPRGGRTGVGVDPLMPNQEMYARWRQVDGHLDDLREGRGGREPPPRLGGDGRT